MMEISELIKIKENFIVDLKYCEEYSKKNIDINEKDNGKINKE